MRYGLNQTTTQRGGKCCIELSVNCKTETFGAARFWKIVAIVIKLLRPSRQCILVWRKINSCTFKPRKNSIVFEWHHRDFKETSPCSVYTSILLYLCTHHFDHERGGWIKCIILYANCPQLSPAGKDVTLRVFLEELEVIMVDGSCTDSRWELLVQLL